MKKYLLLQGITETQSISVETLGIDKLRTLLVTSAKESAFRKVVQATMVRDRQHGPVIELNRISVNKKPAAKDSKTGKPVFMQMVGKSHLLGPESLLLPHRIWKVRYAYSIPCQSLPIYVCQKLSFSLKICLSQSKSCRFLSI